MAHLFQRPKASPATESLRTSLLNEIDDLGDGNNSHKLSNVSNIDSEMASATYLWHSEISSRSMFRYLDIALSVLPMWVVKHRKNQCINMIGFSVTIIFVILLIIDSMCLCITTDYTTSDSHVYFSEALKNSDSESLVTTVFSLIDAFYYPISFGSQIIFYAKYFHAFWTFDFRDNAMINYLIPNMKNIIDKQSILENKSVKKLQRFIAIFFLLQFLCMFTGAAAYCIVDLKLFTNNSATFKLNIPFSNGITLSRAYLLVANAFFSWMPRAVHCTVIVLYFLGMYVTVVLCVHSMCVFVLVFLFYYFFLLSCYTTIEWKFKVRQFIKRDFKRILRRNNVSSLSKMENLLVSHYSNMRKQFKKDTFWLQVWMICDAVQMLTTIYFWFVVDYGLNFNNLSNVLIIIEGSFFITGQLIGFVATWLVAASVTAESNVLFNYGINYINKLSFMTYDKYFQTMEEKQQRIEKLEYENTQGIKLHQHLNDTNGINDYNDNNNNENNMNDNTDNIVKQRLIHAFSTLNQSMTTSSSSGQPITKNNTNLTDFSTTNRDNRLLNTEDFNWFKEFESILPTLTYNKSGKNNDNKRKNNSKSLHINLKRDYSSNKYDRHVRDFRFNKIEKMEQIQAFLIVISEKSIQFKVFGITVDYATLINGLIIFGVAQLASMLFDLV